MADIKKGITSTAAIVILFCLIQNGYSLRYEDDFLETQFDDWQPSKSSALKVKPTASTDPPSPYEPFNDSSLNPTGRNVRQRSREKNGRVESFQSRQGIVNGNNNNNDLNQGYRFKVEQVQETEPVPRNRNGYGSSSRQRNSPRTVPEDTVNGEGIHRRGRKYDGGELSSRRQQTAPINRVQFQRRMSIALDNDQAVAGQISSADVNNIQTPYRGRKYYSDKRVSDLESRALNTRGRTRGFSSRYANVAEVTPSPVGYVDLDQKAYIVLPENQQQKHSQYPLDEISQRYQDRGVEYQRQKQTVVEPIQQHNSGQYHVEVQPGTSEPNAKPFINRDSNFVDYRNPQKEQNSNLVYSQSSLGDVSTQPDVSTQVDYVVPSQQSLPQEEFNQISSFPQPASLYTTAQSGSSESATPKQTHIPETNQNFRSRQSVRRIEKTTQSPIEETVSNNYQKPRSHQRRGNKHEPVLQTNSVADSEPEKRIIEQGTQRDVLGRQRRRQGLIRSNQRTGVYTVLPSNMKTTTQPSEISTTAAFVTPRTRQVPSRENQGLRYNSFRNRSRSQQISTTTEPNAIKQENYNSNGDEPEKPTPPPVKPTLRTVTRLIEKTTAKPPETKPDEDIDETANYPKEFLDKLKVTKKVVSHQVPRIQITTSAPLHQTSPTGHVENVQETTQRGRYSQSFYRKLAAKASYNSREHQKSEQGTKTRFPSKKFNPYPSQPTTSSPQQTTTQAITNPEIQTDAVLPLQERKKFVPKNKVSLEERKHRIELLKEKLRQNATEAQQQKLQETLVPQANTHPGSREEPDPSFTPVKTSTTASISVNTRTTTRPGESEDDEDKTRTTKYDLITQGSEDDVHVVYFNGTGGMGLGPGSVSPSITPFPATTTTPVSIYESASTREPEFAVLNVTLFPSTRHRFSSRINSTTNLTLPRDVELITAPPTPSVLDSPEMLLPREPSLALSVQNLFNSSSNSSAASLRPQEKLSVTQLFDQTTPRVSSTTKRSTTKKKSSGRKKSSKNSSTNRNSNSKNTRRQPSNKGKTSSNNKITSTTVRTPSQRISDNNGNNGTNNTDTTANGLQPLPLALAEIETIINETVEVVHSNPMTSPQPAIVPRSQLNALTPETFSIGEDTSPGTPTTEIPETTTIVNIPTNTSNSTNTNDTSRLESDIQCSGESCRNATSPTLRVNNDQARQTATTKSPETLRQIFIFGLFPNNTIQRRPFNESAVVRTNAQGSGALRSFTTTTTTTAQPDYDVFGIYPNNSVVRRRGWKTFDHERYMSPYVIFGIYPNNTIVKKYPNGTIIRDEFMISDNEIRNIMSERKTQTGCSCANNRTASDNDVRTATTTTTSRTITTTTTTENTDDETTPTPVATTERNPKNDAESIDLDNVTEPQRGDAREVNDSATTTETPQVTTQTQDEDIQEEKRNEQDEDEEEEEEEEEEEVNATTPSQEERLEDIEQVDDASTPRLGLGELTTAAVDQVTEDGRLIDGISPSTTPPDAGLVNAEKADTARIVSTTEYSIPGPTEVTDRADYAERTTTGEDVTDKTTTEFFYYRPTGNSPLSLNIHEGLVERLPPKVVIITPSTSTPKPTTQNPKTQNAIQGLPLFRNNLLGNLLANLGLVNQPTPPPKAIPKTVSPVIPSSTPSPIESTTQTTTTTTITPPTTTQIPKTLPDERFAIDLFGLNTLEDADHEKNKLTTTTNRIPTTTVVHPSVTTILPDDLKEVEILQGLKSHNNLDSIYRTTTGHILRDSDIFVNVLDDSRTTTAGPIHYIQNVNSPTAPYAYERVTAAPIIDYAFPRERPLTGSGIVSITYNDDDQFDSSTINHLQAYHIGQPTGPTYVQRITPRHASVTEIPNTTVDSTEPDLDLRRLGNLIAKLTTLVDTNRGKTEPTTESLTTETTTTSELLNALNDIRSAVSGNQIPKKQRKPTGKNMDEPSSLTNIAYKALSSSSNEIQLLDIVATTSMPSTRSTPTTTTQTTQTTQTKPKKTKTGHNSPERTKHKKITKNLSRTSVMAFKNLTEFTSTPLPETVFIVTPVAKTDSDDEGFRPEPGEVRRPKIKFVTLKPGYVVTTDTQTEKRNQLLTLSSQHVQKVTKAPAKLPENFLSTVYGQIEQRASSPIPEILKNVSNDIEGNGLSVSLAKRIITLALEKAISNETTQMTPISEKDTIYPSSHSLPSTTPYFTPPKPNPTTKKPVDVTKKPTPTTTTTTTERVKPTVSITTKRQTAQTPTTTETIVITPKRETPRPFQTPQEVQNNPSLHFGQSSTAKYVSGIDPLNELFDKGVPTNPPSSQKVTEDLNALLAGLWDESTTKSPTSFTEKPVTSTQKTTSKPQKVKDDKITLPKKASDSLSESDLKLLEGILSQQGFQGGAQDLEQIVQNQIRLAEEVRKASRNFKKKQKTTTTTTHRPDSGGGLGFLFNLFGSQGPSNPPILRGNSRKPEKPSQSESYTSLGNTPDPINELDADFQTADRTARGELVTAAIDVTKAVSKFMGTVLTNAAQSFQSFFRSLRS